MPCMRSTHSLPLTLSHLLSLSHPSLSPSHTLTLNHTPHTPLSPHTSSDAHTAPLRLSALHTRELRSSYGAVRCTRGVSLRDCELYPSHRSYMYVMSCHVVYVCAGCEE